MYLNVKFGQKEYVYAANGNFGTLSYYIRSRLHLFLLEHVVYKVILYPIAKYKIFLKCLLGT
jgi:hypothetical protein